MVPASELGFEGSGGCMEGDIRRVTSEDAPETEEEVNEDAAELEMKDDMTEDIEWRVELTDTSSPMDLHATIYSSASYRFP